MSAAMHAIARLAGAAREPAIAFCRDLVRIPSPSGGEGDAARRTVAEMRSLGFDEADVDGWGNAVGVLRADAPPGERLPGCVLLDAHLDHVDAGDAAAWRHGPFEGVVEAGRLYGRGATDTKSSVAAQVHAAALLARAAREAGVRRRRDLVVAAVVQEEVGGLGTAGLLDSGLDVRGAVVGEPSLGAISMGHRGRIEVEVAFEGRAAHASRPDWGLNPHPSLARFVLALPEVPHDEDPRFGRSSAVPTLVHASPSSPNVSPERVTLTLDWRHVATETPEAVRGRVREVAERCADAGVRAHVRTPTRTLTSWSGRSREIERVSRAFAAPEDAGAVSAAREALRALHGRDVPVIAWDFASDGGWLAARGASCVGYGPGEMSVMHALDESVSLDLVAECVAGTAAIALALDGLAEP